MNYVDTGAAAAACKQLYQASTAVCSGCPFSNQADEYVNTTIFNRT